MKVLNLAGCAAGGLFLRAGGGCGAAASEAMAAADCEVAASTVCNADAVVREVSIVGSLLAE